MPVRAHGLRRADVPEAAEDHRILLVKTHAVDLARTRDTEHCMRSISKEAGPNPRNNRRKNSRRKGGALLLASTLSPIGKGDRRPSETWEQRTSIIESEESSWR